MDHVMTKQRRKLAPGAAACLLLISLALAACAGTGSLPAAGSPAPSATQAKPSGPSREARRVEAAVDNYFRDDANRDYRSMAADSTGPISALWLWYDAEYGSCTCPVERLTIDHIAATKVERSTAFVSLGAALQASDHVTKFSGPVRLQKIAGRWHVVDYLRNGVPLAPTIHAVSDAPAVQADDVSFQILGTQEIDNLVEVWLHTTNSRAASIRIVSVSIATATGGFVHQRSFPTADDLLVLPGRFAVRPIAMLGPAGRAAGGRLRLRIGFKDTASGETFTTIATNG